MKKTAHLFAFLILACTMNAAAALHLPDIFSDNMVMQQRTLAPMWGKANPNEKITVTASWTTRKFTTTADSRGNWKTEIKTPRASNKPQTVTVTAEGGESITLNNVLVGEVWLCSGQSNMEMPVRGFNHVNNPLPDSTEVALNSEKFPNIHCVTIKWQLMANPADECNGRWLTPSRHNTMGFSAVGYHFAKALNEKLNIPIGIIVAAWGGTCINGWLPQEIVKDYAPVDYKLRSTEAPNAPCARFNGLIAPLKNYAIAGVLWYQGESDAYFNTQAKYDERLTKLMKCWRTQWRNAKLPFYIVEIAPYNYQDKGFNAAYVRECEYKIATSDRFSGIVSTNDLIRAEELEIPHPAEKTEVGIRLCNLALSNLYKKRAATYGPTFKGAATSGAETVVTFNCHGSKLMADEPITGFEMAGADSVFHAAKAKIIANDKIALTADGISNPSSIRYCFKGWQLGNLKAENGLPAFPFRTDKWTNR